MRTCVVWNGPRRITAGLATVACVATVGLAGPLAQPAAAGPPKVTAKIVGTIWGDKKADFASKDGVTGRYDAKYDLGSLFTMEHGLGVDSAWAKKDRSGKAVTGQGVTVAVVDSGVSGVPGLDAAGKLVQGPDLSLEANSDDLAAKDTFGHGTHMAGIIGARDASVAVDPKTGAVKPDPTKLIGVAPGSKLLALKLATTDGSTDVSQVIAALDWVTQHKDDAGMNVRVVNLSFGTTAVQPYQVDPLATAAENAWHHGIVVVVSGGNVGTQATSLTNPAIDPYVIAVGAADPWAVVDPTRPLVADFSSRGTAARHVDLLAPGTSVVSLRNPGSSVDVNNPSGLVTGDTTGRLFRGSGTSQAAAVVSGAAALLLQARPDLTPDAVKAALVSTVTRVPGLDPLAAGAGVLNVGAAVDAVQRSGFSATTGQQSFPVADGSGSLELARGGSNLVDTDSGALLAGEVDILGTAWDGQAWSQASAAGTAWEGGLWRGARFAGDSWTDSGWARARWADTAWNRARWADVSWDRARWARARWADASWERARWAGSAWS